MEIARQHLWDLLGRMVIEWNDVNNFMELEHSLHKKCNRMDQTLISAMRRFVGDWGVKGSHPR